MIPNLRRFIVNEWNVRNMKRLLCAVMAAGPLALVAWAMHQWVMNLCQTDPHDLYRQADVPAEAIRGVALRIVIAQTLYCTFAPAALVMLVLVLSWPLREQPRWVRILLLVTMTMVTAGSVGMCGVLLNKAMPLLVPPSQSVARGM